MKNTNNKVGSIMLLMFTSTESKFNGKIIPVGEHKVKTTTVAVTTAGISEHWTDLTQQLEVGFKDEEGNVITHWFNIDAFKNSSDYKGGIAPKGHEFRSSEIGNENYCVNIKTGERVKSEEKMAECQRMIEEFGFSCGIAKGKSFTETDLVNKAVGIGVRKNSRDMNEVYYNKPASKVKATADAEA